MVRSKALGWVTCCVQRAARGLHVLGVRSDGESNGRRAQRGVRRGPDLVGPWSPKRTLAFFSKGGRKLLESFEQRSGMVWLSVFKDRTLLTFN